MKRFNGQKINLKIGIIDGENFIIIYFFCGENDIYLNNKWDKLNTTTSPKYIFWENVLSTILSKLKI